jgi:rhodanese-related sulfurtransferase
VSSAPSPSPSNNHRLARALAFSLALTTTTTAVAQPSDPATAARLACPLMAGLPLPTKAATPRVVTDPSCLIAASAVTATDRIYDLRERDEYVRFHLPAAEHATAGSLATTPGIEKKPVIVYESGRFRSDAFLLCDRLRHAGVAQVKVIDGGIAAWAQRRAAAELVALNRLSDTDVPTALLDATPGTVVVLSESLRPVLRELALASDVPPKKPGARALLLADPQTPIATVQARLSKAPALYWVGTGERLRQLLTRQLAQENKRQAGPAESTLCSAL